MKDSSWRVEFSCPQCGAPSALAETDRLFFCPYCRTRSYLLSSGPFQFCLPSKPEFAEDKSVAVPYWRIRGVLFSRREGSATCAFSLVDTTEAALPSPLLPRSLGIVPQAIPLRFAFPRTGMRYLAVQGTIEHGLSRTLEVLDALDPARSGSEARLRCFVGETTSVVYAPLILRSDSIVDGIRGKPLCPGTDLEAIRLLGLAERTRWQISFLPAFCPSCGWDLEGETDSAVLLCRNCASAWVPTPSGFSRCPLRFLTGSASCIFLPFWKFAHEPYEETDAFCATWIPGFKTRPDLLLKLARRITLWHPKPPLDGSIETHELYPVTLPAAEAGQLLPFLGPIETAPQTDCGSESPEEGAPAGPILVYVGFDQNPSELFHRQAKVALFRGALRHGRNL